MEWERAVIRVRRDDKVEDRRRLSCLAWNGAHALVGGGPEGKFTVLEWGDEEVRVVQESRLETEDGRRVVAPLSEIVWVGAQEMHVVFTLWQSNMVFWTDLADTNGLVLCAKPDYSIFDIGSISTLCRDGIEKKFLRLAFGSSKGVLQCVEFDEIASRHGPTFERAKCKVLLSIRIGDEIMSTGFIPMQGNKQACLAAGLAGGSVHIWASNSNYEMEKTCVIETGRTPITCIAGAVNLLVAGLDNGFIFVWDLHAATTGNSDALLASLGNTSEEPISALLTRRDRDQEGHEILNLIVGDDSGQVTQFSSLHEKMSSTSWKISQRKDLKSPIVSLCGKMKVLAGTCEMWIQPVRMVSSMRTNEEKSKVVSVTNEETPEPEPVPKPTAPPNQNRESNESAENEEERESEIKEETSTSDSTEEESTSESDEETTSDSDVHAFSSSTSGSESDDDDDEDDDDDDDDDDCGVDNKEGRDVEETVLSIDDESEPLEVPPMACPYPKQNVTVNEQERQLCYDGYIDQDIPPLPLSKYAEPSLHSSERIKVALERLKLRQFSPKDDAHSPSEMERMRVAKVLDVARHDAVYQDLVPIRSDVQPILVPRKISAALAAKLKNRKTIMERQQEMIERHRLEKLAKQLDDEAEKLTHPDFKQRVERTKQSKAKRREDEEEHASESAKIYPVSCYSEEEQSSLCEDHSSNSVLHTPSFHPSWSRPEFYLSKFEDGRIGFHNFRSLQS